MDNPSDIRVSVEEPGDDIPLLRAINDTLARFKMLVWLVVAVGAALGFGLKLPGQTIKQMQVQIDSLKMSMGQVVTVNNKVDMLLRLQCIDQKPGNEKVYLAAGISCDNILGVSRGAR